MPATTARGTDAERTEEAAPVVLEEALELVADAAALLVLDDKRVELVTAGALDCVVLFVDGTLEGRMVGTTDGTLVGVSVPGTTEGMVSRFPSSLDTKSSEKHWHSRVSSRGTSRGTYEEDGEMLGASEESPVSSCGRAKAAAATRRSVKNWAFIMRL